TLIQTTPESNHTQLTGENSTYTQALTVKKESGENNNNYYPGVPYLTARKTEAQTTAPIVQFASTNTKTTSGYYGLQNHRGPPQEYATNHYTRLTTTTNPKPDFHIIIHPASHPQQQSISRTNSANTNWKTYLHNKNLFVTLTDAQLPEFQQLLPPSAPPHKKLDFSPLTSQGKQKLFTIAVSFD
nr:hypothetical protein [Spirochaetales bacterium]